MTFRENNLTEIRKGQYVAWKPNSGGWVIVQVRGRVENSLSVWVSTYHESNQIRVPMASLYPAALCGECQLWALAESEDDFLCSSCRLNSDGRKPPVGASVCDPRTGA